jgi:hypothetical protein
LAALLKKARWKSSILIEALFVETFSTAEHFSPIGMVLGLPPAAALSHGFALHIS